VNDKIERGSGALDPQITEEPDTNTNEVEALTDGLPDHLVAMVDTLPLPGMDADADVDALPDTGGGVGHGRRANTELEFPHILLHLHEQTTSNNKGSKSCKKKKKPTQMAFVEEKSDDDSEKAEDEDEVVGDEDNDVEDEDEDEEVEVDAENGDVETGDEGSTNDNINADNIQERDKDVKSDQPKFDDNVEEAAEASEATENRRVASATSLPVVCADKTGKGTDRALRRSHCLALFHVGVQHEHLSQQSGLARRSRARHLKEAAAAFALGKIIPASELLTTFVFL
jgi:hypothetical protein